MLDRSTIEHLEASGPVLIALSGGGDSTALLHLLVERLGADRLRAGIVDHKLRDGSARDAERAAGFAEALGVEALTLTLNWRKDANRGQQAARRARYAVLCNAARACGASVIAAAHTADDQAETVLMRAASGSGWRGLAGMAAIASAPLWPEGRRITIARPLLGARRADLRAHLRDRGADWIEDPANTNPAYTRVKARARLAALEAGGLDPMRLAELAQKLRALAPRSDAEASALIAACAQFADDAIWITRADWRASGETRRRALAVLIAAAAGADREPEHAALQRLEARWMHDGFRGASLGGARIARKGERLRLSRDLGALHGRADGARPAPPLALPVGVECVWDGRLALRAATPGWSIAQGKQGVELARGGELAPLAEAQGAGLRADWLLQLHAEHRLGPLSTTKTGPLAPAEPLPFTPP